MLQGVDGGMLAATATLCDENVPSVQYVTHFPKEEKYVSILRQVRLALLLQC